MTHPTNGWITIACVLLIPISFWTGWIDSVRFNLADHCRSVWPWAH